MGASPFDCDLSSQGTCCRRPSLTTPAAHRNLPLGLVRVLVCLSIHLLASCLLRSHSQPSSFWVPGPRPSARLAAGPPLPMPGKRANTWQRLPLPCRSPGPVYLPVRVVHVFSAPSTHPAGWENGTVGGDSQGGCEAEAEQAPSPRWNKMSESEPSPENVD
uniref:Uncharacterized protein n=1 Tax=Mustela putorius furo TaxID=9669 RepID=M3YY61_MUSPF